MTAFDPLSRAFLDASVQTGTFENPDYNAEKFEGASWLQFSIRNGRRMSTAQCYIEPAKSRPNLSITPDAMAERLLLDGKRCTGVRFSVKGQPLEARAAREVIVSTGDGLVLPNLAIQLHVEGSPMRRNVSLVATGPNQNHQGWRRLELALGAALNRIEVRRNPQAIVLLGAGGLLALAVILAITWNPQAVAQSLFDLLRL